MSFKKLVSMNIAVIGNTATAAKYAIGFAQAGHNVYMACAGTNDCKHLGIDDDDNISYCTIADAADIADLIVMATRPVEVREAAYWLDDVRRKVIIDATPNEVDPAENIVKTVYAISAITGAKHIAKVFHAHGYQHILKPLFQGAEVDMMLLSDSKKAKEITKIMAIELGLSVFYDFGSTDALPLFNELARSLRNLKQELPQPLPVIASKAGKRP